MRVSALFAASLSSNQPEIAQSLWQQPAEGVSVAMDLVRRFDGGGEKFSINVSVKNSSRVQEFFPGNFSTNGNVQIQIFFVEDNGEQIPLNGYTANPPSGIEESSVPDIGISQPGETIITTIDLTPIEVAVVRKHPVFCRFIRSFKPEGGYTSISSEPVLLTHQEIMIDKSLSPDGSKYITIKDKDPDGIEGVALGTANVIDAATGKTLGSFDWEGFGYHPNKTAFEVLWKPDCKAFAISWELNRGFSTNAVYLSYQENWMKIDLPDCFHKINQLCQDDRGKHFKIIPEMGGKGREIVKEWLADDRLRLEAEYTQFSGKNGPDGYPLFSVIYHIKNTHGKTLPEAVLEKVEIPLESAHAG